MDIIRKIQYLLFCLLAIGFVACDDDNDEYATDDETILSVPQDDLIFTYEGEAKTINVTASENTFVASVTTGDETAQQLWSSSPLIVNTGRTTTLTKIQGYADKCKDDYFVSYLNGFDQASTSMEKCDPIIYFYRSAFDRVMDGIKNSKVENGTAAIW